MRHGTITRTTLMASASLALCLVALSSGSADARITKIQITRVEKPTFEGTSFGAVGQYEKLVGRAYGEVDPKDPRNAVIVDIANAPKNARGMVEYDTDIYILKPIDNAKGNHRLWFEVNNRGNLPAYESMTEAHVDGNDPTKAADAGNGFLMRQGYTILEAGWDISAPNGGGRFTIRVPVAKNPDGSPIVGPSMEEFVVANATTKRGRLTYPAASLHKSNATPTLPTRYEDTPVTLASENWQERDEMGAPISLIV